MPKSLEEHADNWDLRHEDFKDNDFLYDVYSVMRRNAPFAHTDTPFLGVTPGGAWVATRYEECYRIAQDWQHFSAEEHGVWDRLFDRQVPYLGSRIVRPFLEGIPKLGLDEPGIPDPSH